MSSFNNAFSPVINFISLSHDYTSVIKMRDFILKIFDNVSLIHKFISINESNAEFSRPFIVFDKFFLKHKGEMSFFTHLPRYFR